MNEAAGAFGALAGADLYRATRSSLSRRADRDATSEGDIRRPTLDDRALEHLRRQTEAVFADAARPELAERLNRGIASPSDRRDAVELAEQAIENDESFRDAVGKGLRLPVNEAHRKKVEEGLMMPIAEVIRLAARMAAESPPHDGERWSRPHRYWLERGRCPVRGEPTEATYFSRAGWVPASHIRYHPDAKARCSLGHEWPVYSMQETPQLDARS
jgi:hypothetical protein